MAVSATTRGWRPTLADLVAAAKPRDATNPPSVGLVEPEALAASGQVRLDPATGSPIVTLDDLDIVDSESGDCGEHGEWFIALVEHPHAPSHARRRRRTTQRKSS